MRRAQILTIGTVVDGRATGWKFEYSRDAAPPLEFGPDNRPSRFSGYTMDELAAIAAGEVDAASMAGTEV